MLYVNLGAVSVTQSPTGIKVTDGEGVIKTDIKSGKICYARTETGGVLYIDGIKAGEHHYPQDASNPLVDASIYGEGTISDVKTFSELSELQAEVVSYGL